MKGKFLHTKIIAATLIQAIRWRGYRIHLEYPVRHGPRPPAVDILFEAEDAKIALEIECSAERVPNDAAKAQTLEADLFAIVTPNARIARAVSASLKRLDAAHTANIHVMTFGAALQWIANNCPFSVRP